MSAIDLTLKIEIGLHKDPPEGRGGFKTGMRPNHWIPGRDYTFIGQIDFMGRDHLAPGGSCEAILRCIVATQDEHLFVPGFAWHICAANRIFGYAKVL